MFPTAITLLFLLLTPFAAGDSGLIPDPSDRLAPEITHPQVIPNLSSYTWNRTFYATDLTATPAYSFAIAWNISNPGTVNESFDYSLILGGPPDRSDPFTLQHAYVGIGFGTSMVHEAEFNVCHMKVLPIDGGPGGIRAHEHFSQISYAPPTHYYGPNPAATVVGGNYTSNGQLVCTFQRKTHPNNTLHHILDPTSLTDMIWAFNPRSNLNYRGDWFTYHGSNHRGAITAVLGDGIMVDRTPVSVNNKIIHGAGMAFEQERMDRGPCHGAGLGNGGHYRILGDHPDDGHLLRSGACAGRLPHGIDLPTPPRPRTQLGAFIICGVLIQLTLGIFNALRLSNETVARVAGAIRMTHNLFGASLLVLSTAQIYLGLDTLNPTVQPLIPGLWGLYWGLVGFWGIAFVGTEAYFYLMVRRKDIGINKVAVLSMGGAPATERKGKYVTDQVVGTVPVPAQNDTEKMRTFTWKSLHEAIMNDG
ncbi:hypothetical protein BDK51DRAFT_51976 [Blyttiomyces helicus]|uniref:DOMON domain-containing protein n=1 Tax=Blyttiomyces helicus TaxID=388810 RepID=A0A4P9W7H9_9FUNG|nr:hypothetical protein BDK51DRAFT_51976 [Blyttiomyces helicus]|eukprot:RKO86116.1 hypothetical protein BDK51DRAFT_51976 [Blyttiomyces helicus]